MSTKLKKLILEEAINDRQHLIIPDCANQPKRLQDQIDSVKAAGYELHIICLWAPLSVTRARGEPRSMRDGKMWSPDDYETSTRGMATLALRWAEKMREAPASYKSMSVWDNTVFPAQEVSLDRFVELSACGHAEADAHLRRRQSVTEDAHQKAMSNMQTALFAARLRARSRDAAAASLAASAAALSAAAAGSAAAALPRKASRRISLFARAALFQERLGAGLAADDLEAAKPPTDAAPNLPTKQPQQPEPPQPPQQLPRLASAAEAPHEGANGTAAEEQPAAGGAEAKVKRGSIGNGFGLGSKTVSWRHLEAFSRPSVCRGSRAAGEASEASAAERSSRQGDDAAEAEDSAWKLEDAWNLPLEGLKSMAQFIQKARAVKLAKERWRHPCASSVTAFQAGLVGLAVGVLLGGGGGYGFARLVDI